MSAGAPYDARAVANLLLDLADEQKRPLSQLALLKLIYFSHGWYLAEHSRPLVSQDFEAWELGPVVKVVRDEFHKFGRKPITARAKKLNIYTGEREEIKQDITAEDSVFIRGILNAYRDYTGWELSELSHEKGSPWDILWNTERPIGRLALRITNDEIKSYFCKS